MQPCRHLNQKLVAGQMAYRVIYVLEAIGIQEQYCQHALPAAFHSRERVAESERELGAVGKPGQSIEVGGKFKLSLRNLSLGDVVDNGPHHSLARGRLHLAAGHQSRKARAILAYELLLA